MVRVLDPAAEAQLAEARDLLGTIRDSLTRFGATSDDLAALAASIRQLDDLFLVVVVGEFNAGKSAFINALLGDRVLAEGVTPTTAQIHLLKYGETLARNAVSENYTVITAPIELLRDLHIVDTPGTNAIIREHERLTTDFVPRSDLVLFVTSADRPFTDTERAFLQTIRDWGKKIVIIVNKADILTAAEKDEVMAFVKRAAHDMLRVDVHVMSVSARLALRAKRGEPSVWAASGFEALEQYLRDTLDARTRFRLKLANPLGVGRALADRYATIARERLALIGEDVSLLADTGRQLETYREDMERGFELRISAVEKELGDMEARGQRFFEDTLRVGRFVDLLNRARVQKEFEEKVVADAPARIERRVAEVVDWLVDQDFRQWQAITSKLADRQRQHASRILGAPEIGHFHSDRMKLIESVGREAQRVVSTYDKQHEAATIADQARVAVAAAAATGGAAVGLGTIITVAASTLAADVTGILLASAVLGVGFLIIPARRRRAKKILADKVADLRQRLAQTLQAEFRAAQEQSRRRLDDAIAPYAQFVRAEDRRWTEAEQSLVAMRDRSGALLNEVGSDAPPA